MALREYEKEKGIIENACGCRNENFILKAVNNHKLQTIEDKKAKRPEIVCMNKTKHFPKKHITTLSHSQDKGGHFNHRQVMQLGPLIIFHTEPWAAL